MKNQCRKRVKKQGRFDHDFEAKIDPKSMENRSEMDSKSMEKGSRYTVEI